MADDDIIAALGGAQAVAAMDHEGRAEALEVFMVGKLEADIEARASGKSYPSVAEYALLVETRSYRRGVGTLFMPPRQDPPPGQPAPEPKVKRLAPLPECPTLVDFIEKRFYPAAHLLQSAALAKRRGNSEEVVLACLLHDIGISLVRAEHGYWSAQLIEPYVSEKVAFAIRYHQPLRFFADPAYDYDYPQVYYRIFGHDYVPPAYVLDGYTHARNHKWYEEARLVTINDLYAFDAEAVVSIDEFRELIGRHFRQPKEGLGFDGSPVAHMWRSLNFADQAL